ncbi:MAG: hypothetical protein CO099_11510 [Bdellovibrio sp. CG_4_9_14_3_um_filter_39_7]|nr:MAG: hypothetical protein CO099_11510 [Bdellovibrio sp. CG_4_9_14_3_um_filter_39_7]
MGKFKTIFVCDVLEHIENDHLFIKHLYELLDDHGQIIISVPILSSEWRWDDDFYGHVRRYEIPDLIYLLGQNNLRVRQIWDFTFPFFWLIRRIYTKIIPKKIIFKDPLNNTKNSARQSAWDHGILTALFEKILWWDLLFKIQIKFKNHLVGCECVLIATKE